MIFWGFIVRSGEFEGCKLGGLILLRKLRGRGEEGRKRRGRRKGRRGRG